jgi:hypothetical protein
MAYYLGEEWQHWYDDIHATIKEATEIKDKPTLIKVSNQKVIFLLFFSLMQFYQTT